MRSTDVPAVKTTEEKKSTLQRGNCAGITPIIMDPGLTRAANPEKPVIMICVFSAGGSNDQALDGHHFRSVHHCTNHSVAGAHGETRLEPESELPRV